MKKAFIVVIVVIMSLSSCKYTVDKTNIYSVAEAIHKSFIKKDTTILKKIFLYQMDSISLYQRKSIAEIQKFYTPDLEIIKMDTSVGWWNSYLDLFYKKEGDFFQIRASYERDSTDEIFVKYLSLTNINEECEEAKETPYCPDDDVQFMSLNTTPANYGKTLTKGEVILQNNTDSDLNYIKFRVILKHGNSRWTAKTFFNQTVESYQTIYKGDISYVKIPGLSNFYTGFKTEKDNFFFSAELIEVLPKPESPWCKMLKELEDEVINRSE